MSHCLPGGLAVEPLQQTLQQNRALHRSTTEAPRPAADVELYSSTALSSSTALQRSTLYILYTLPQVCGCVGDCIIFGICEGKEFTRKKNRAWCAAILGRYVAGWGDLYHAKSDDMSGAADVHYLGLSSKP